MLDYVLFAGSVSDEFGVAAVVKALDEGPKPVLESIAASDDEPIVDTGNVEILERAFEDAIRTGVHCRLGFGQLVDGIGAQLGAQTVDLAEHLVKRVRGRDGREALAVEIELFSYLVWLVADFGH